MMALLKNYINLIQRKRLPTSWIFFVTSKCNSKCSHCFYWKDLNKIDNELTLNDIQKITLNMGYFDNLLISGGEPTLRNDIADICHLFYVNNKIKSIHFPTNGLNPDNIYDKINLILERCKGIKLNIGLPLDGLEGTNDYLRGVKGAFRNVVKTAEKLADLKKRFPNLTTYIISVVSNMNYGEMLPLAEYVSKLPVDDHGPSPLRGSPKDYELKPPTSSQWKKLTKDFFASKSLIFKKSENARDIIQRNRRVSMYKYYSKILDKGFIMPCRA